MTKASLPPVLDFEASSLSDGSYPITAGLVVGDEVKYWIIKPRPDWVDWSLTSQAIHGMKRSFLMEYGCDAVLVYEELKAALEAVGCIYSDNPYWEKRWLACLGKVNVDIRDIRDLIPVDVQTQWQARVEQIFIDQKLTRHRADHDAYAISFAASSFQGLD